MSSFFTGYKELHSPTTVEHSVKCSFLYPSSHNLVVAKTSLLQVYSISEYDYKNNWNETQNARETGKLELVGQYKLFGNIEALEFVRLAGYKTDSLLLGFSDAKLSLIHFDQSTNDIDTISIHYYERDEYKKTYMDKAVIPEIRVDPLNRCACMTVYHDNIAILPFRSPTNVEPEDILEQRKPFYDSFVIECSKIKANLPVRNVIDVHFLHGYYLPTMAILYESSPTWTGRLAVKKDTVSVVVIALHLSENTFSTLWNIDNLPYDCRKIIPLSKPSGGAVIISANAILFVEQSMRNMGVSVNNYSKITTDFPLQNLDDICISLDGSRYTFLTENCLLLGLKNGDLCLAHFIAEGGSLSAIKVEMNISGVVPSCLCTINDKYVFIGSRLGDSLLLKYTRQTKSRPESDKRPNKRRKLATEENDIFSGDDDNDFFGDVTVREEVESLGYNFELQDTLLNIGPVSDSAIATPSKVEEIEENKFYDSRLYQDLEVVTCSGHGRTGALCILQQNVRPQILSTWDPLENFVTPWALRCISDEFFEENDEIAAATGQSVEQTHNLFLLSSDTSTMLLAINEDTFEQIEKPGAKVHVPTIHAQSVFNDTRILQICSNTVYLIKSDQTVPHWTPIIGNNVHVVSCMVQEPYILLQLNDMSIRLLQLNPEEKDFATFQFPSDFDDQEIAAAYIYHDKNSTFITVDQLCLKNESEPHVKEKRKVQTEPEDEDDFFGEESGETPASTSDTPENIERETVHIESLMWLFIHRTNGALEIYRMTDFKCVFSFPYFEHLPSVLADTHMKRPKEAVTDMHFNEICVSPLGEINSDNYLLARSPSGDLIIYKMFYYLPTDPNELNTFRNRLAIRFSRFHHNLILRRPLEFLEEERAKILAQKELAQARSSHDRVIRRRTIIPFSGVSGYKGIFVAGYRPVFIISSRQRWPRLHPMKVDGKVFGFSAFHSDICPSGFVYFNQEFCLRICQFRDDFIYDGEWPYRKVMLRSTPHHIGYHLSTQTYVVIASNSVPFSLKDEPDFDKKHAERLTIPETEQFSIILVSPQTWTPIDKFDLEDNEYCTCMKSMILDSKSTVSGKKCFIALGTSMLKGEDYSSKGAIYIFDVISVVPEADKPYSEHKLKLIHTTADKSMPFKGPITALAGLNGYLVACSGSKVLVHSFEDNESLIQIEFFDAQLYVTSMSTVNNFLIFGDEYKSVSFLAFQEDPPQLKLLGKDYSPMGVNAVDFLISDNKMMFASFDHDKNISVHAYLQTSNESLNGQKLLRRADMHLGSEVNRVIRIAKRPYIFNRTGVPKHPLHHCAFFGTMDGGLGLLMPVSEIEYRRQQTLQTKMQTFLNHYACLNARAFRLHKTKERQDAKLFENILDGVLLSRFQNLSLTKQKELAKSIGSTIDKIINDQLEIDMSTDFF